MSDPYDALVIGGGPAGLATSRELGRGGVSHLVVERGREVGQTWADLYDSLVLHTTRGLSALPGLAFPSGTPRFPTRLDLLAYLRKYARTFSLPVQCGAGIIGLRRSSDVWIARTAGGEDLSAHTAVVATGIVSSPYVPDLPGRASFGGRIVHSVEYRRPGPFLGQRVLVIGAGNSAADISVELARAGIDVILAVRSGAIVVPLQVAGIPIQYLGFALASLPRGAQRVLATALGKVSGGRATLPRTSIGECTRVPVIGLRLSRALRAGAIRLKGGVSELVATGVRFSDGAAAPIDTIILATGYRAAVGFLDDPVRLDHCGFARRSDAVTSADQPNLYFVGHTPDTRGGLYRIARDATVAAARIKATLDDTRRRSTERRRRHNEK